MAVQSDRRKTIWCLPLDQLQSFDVCYNTIQTIQKRYSHRRNSKPQVYMLDAPPGPDRDHFVQTMSDVLSHYKTTVLYQSS